MNKENVFVRDTIEMLYSLGEPACRDALIKYSADSLYEIARHLKMDFTEEDSIDNFEFISEISSFLFPPPIIVWVSVKRDGCGKFFTHIELGDIGGFEFGSFELRAEALEAGDRYVDTLFKKEIEKSSIKGGDYSVGFQDKSEPHGDQKESSKKEG